MSQYVLDGYVMFDYVLGNTAPDYSYLNPNVNDLDPNVNIEIVKVYGFSQNDFIVSDDSGVSQYIRRSYDDAYDSRAFVFPEITIYNLTV